MNKKSLKKLIIGAAGILAVIFISKKIKNKEILPIETFTKTNENDIEEEISEETENEDYQENTNPEVSSGGSNWSASPSPGW